MSSKHQKAQKSLNNYARYSSLVFQMGIIILGGTFGGIQLDKKLLLEFPIFTVIFSFLSVVLALYFGLKDFIKKK